MFARIQDAIEYIYYIVEFITFINFFGFQSSVWPEVPLVTEGGWKYTIMANGEQYARTTSICSKQLSSAKCWGCKYHVNLASKPYEKREMWKNL